MQNNTKSPNDSTVQTSFSLNTPRFVEERNHKLHLENKLLEVAIDLAQQRARCRTESLNGDGYEQHCQGSSDTWWAAYDAKLKAEFLLVHQHNKAGTLVDYVSGSQTTSMIGANVQTLNVA